MLVSKVAALPALDPETGRVDSFAFEFCATPILAMLLLGGTFIITMNDRMLAP
jgi:hypothetical protein